MHRDKLGEFQGWLRYHGYTPHTLDTEHVSLAWRGINGTAEIRYMGGDGVWCNEEAKSYVSAFLQDLNRRKKQA